MTMLTVNNITESFLIPASVSVDEKNAVIDFALKSDDERGCALIEGLWRELSALMNDYPEFVRVTVK